MLRGLFLAQQKFLLKIANLRAVGAKRARTLRALTQVVLSACHFSAVQEKHLLQTGASRGRPATTNKPPATQSRSPRDKGRTSKGGFFHG